MTSSEDDGGRDAAITEEDETDEDESAPDGRRRTPPEADALRARMVREGYPLADLTTRENNRIWVTLTQRRRWDELQRLTGMRDADLQARIKAISRQHLAATGRK